MQKQQRHTAPPASIRFTSSNGPEGGGGGSYGVKVLGAQPQHPQQPQSGQPPQPTQEKPSLQLHQNQYQSPHVQYNAHPRQSVAQSVPGFWPPNLPIQGRHPRQQQQPYNRIVQLVNYGTEGAQGQMSYPTPGVYPVTMNQVLYNLGGGGEGGGRSGGGGPPHGGYWAPPAGSLVMQQQMPQQLTAVAAAAAANQSQHQASFQPYYSHQLARISSFTNSGTPPTLPQQTQQLQQQQPPIMVNNGQAGGGLTSMVGSAVNIMTPGQRDHHQVQGSSISKLRAKRVPIIDPKTGNEVEVEVENQTAPTSHQEHHPPPSTGTGQTAAEFAQKVAAVAAEEWPREVEEKIAAPKTSPATEKSPIPEVPAPSAPAVVAQQSPATIPPAAVSEPPASSPKESSFKRSFNILQVKEQAISALAAVAAQAEEPPVATPQQQQQSGKAQQKAKHRAKAKQRDINMKDKEGSDMDAFTDGPANRDASPAPAVIGAGLAAVSTTNAAAPTAPTPAVVACPDEEEEQASDALVAARNRENARPVSPPAADVIETRVISRTEPERPVLKYEYKDDQWSPLNPTGKRVYDREFLLKLRQDPLSSKKPENILPDLDIVRDQPGRDRLGDRGGDSGPMRRNVYTSGYGSMQRNNGFAPGFFQSSSLSQGSRMSSNKRMVQTRGSGSRDGGRGSKNYNSQSLRDDIRLNQSENAWKPLKLNKDRRKENKEDSDTEELYRKVRGILNKLTPQKFDVLLGQFKALPINSIERLRGVIALVFEKAIDEPAFSSSYAELCRFLVAAKFEVSAQTVAQAPKAPEPQENVTIAPPKAPENFRKILITRCQTEFENNKKAELDFEKRQQDIDECPDPDKRKELQLLFNEEERKIRMKSVGLVRFIGELYKLKMLTGNIMHGCIRQLLGKYDEENLECLCKLLTTIGKELEIAMKKTEGNKESMTQENEWNDYFVRMEQLSRKDCSMKVSSRVRFMLQDVIELRENKWVPRRVENKPKTMAQIQEEVEKETEKAAAQLAAQPLRRHDDSRRRRDGNPRGSNSQSEDGWNVVGKGSNMYRANYSLEATKIQAIRNVASLDMQNQEVHLGSAKNFMRWGSGASAKGNSTGTPGSLSDNKFTTNAFSPLNADSDDRKPPASLAIRTGKPSPSSERERAVLALKTFEETAKNQAAGLPSRRGEKIREMPTSPQQSMPTPVEEVRKVQMMSTDEMNLRLKGIVKQCQECYKSKKAEDLKDAFLSLKEVFEKTCQEDDAVLEIINKNMEMKSKDGRIFCYGLIGQCISVNLVKIETFINVMRFIVENANELIIDLPNLWSYLGEVFAPLIGQEVIDFSHFKTAAEPVGVKAELESTIKEIFRYLIVEKGPAWIKELWDKCGVKLIDFLPEEKARSFLEEYAFVEGAKVTVRDSNLPFEIIEEKLLAFLKENKGQKFDHIFDWLTINVGNKTSEPQFIDILMKAVIMSSIVPDSNNSEAKFDKALFSNYIILIKRYVDNKEELELRCLYTVQNLVVLTLESPSGMLVEIFSQLCDSAAVSPEGFMKWYKEDTTSQVPGKGVAVKTLSSFFQALKEDLAEDDPS